MCKIAKQKCKIAKLLKILHYIIEKRNKTNFKQTRIKNVTSIMVNLYKQLLFAVLSINKLLF